LQFGYQRRVKEALTQQRNNLIDDEKCNKLIAAFEQQASEEFIKTLKSEAVALDIELRHRLSPNALGSIFGAGPALDPNITIASLIPGQIGTFGIEITANELEQMNAKLPPDQRHWWIWPVILIAIALLFISLFWAIHSGVRIVRIRDSQSRPPSQA
jgi:hypothetical protein